LVEDRAVTGVSKNIQTGTIGELAFILACYHRNYIVSIPYSVDSKYDFIVDNGKSLYRVQVKTSAKARKDRPNIYDFTIGHGRYVKGIYHNIDYFALYAVDIDTFWIVPRAATLGKVRLGVHINNPTYKKYRDNFTLDTIY
jgi:hypothetical protein